MNGEDPTKVRLLVTKDPEEEAMISTALFNLNKQELIVLAQMEEIAEEKTKTVDYGESVQDYLASNMFSIFDECTGQTTAYL